VVIVAYYCIKNLFFDFISNATITFKQIYYRHTEVNDRVVASPEPGRRNPPEKVSPPSPPDETRPLALKIVIKKY